MGAWKIGADHARDEQELSDAFKGFVGQPFALPVSGARAGLWYTLQWLKEEYGPGEVVIPALTASIVPNVVAASGHTPRFCDVDPVRFTSGPDDLLNCVNKNTRAVIATHLEGFPMRVDVLKEALASSKVTVIEDVAHAPGAMIKDKPAGAYADVAVFSLGKGKHLNALDGGVLVTRDPGLFAYARQSIEDLPWAKKTGVLKKLGLVQSMVVMTRRPFFDVSLWPTIRFFARRDQDPLYDRFLDEAGPLPRTGPASARVRLNPLQCRLATSALDALPKQLALRVAMHQRYSAAASDALTIQQSAPGTTPAPLEFVVRTKSRWEARMELWRLGIDSQGTWMQSPDMLPTFAATAGSFPVAEQLARELVYLPFYPGLSEAEQSRMEEILERPPASLCT